MDIKHIELSGRGAFVIKRDHERIAELTYKRDGDTINIDHTEVDESLRGQHVGQKLVDEAVKFARENNLKITATCPYASKVLSRSSEYSDVFSSAS
jgi:predicted GNAT family acetyltransferase